MAIHPPPHAWRRQRGFTLIELMITVAIIGTLLAIAIPSYRSHIAKGYRAQARSEVLQAQQWMERFYSENYRYDKNLADVDVNDAALFGNQFSKVPRPGEGGSPAYTMSVTATSRSFTVTAARITPGTMASDACGDYRVSQTGRRSVVNYTGYATALDAARACWR
jgi:type IV pilus assembly protein PilE